MFYAQSTSSSSSNSSSSSRRRRRRRRRRGRRRSRSTVVFYAQSTSQPVRLYQGKKKKKKKKHKKVVLDTSSETVMTVCYKVSHMVQITSECVISICSLRLSQHTKIGLFGRTLPPKLIKAKTSIPVCRLKCMHESVWWWLPDTTETFVESKRLGSLGSARCKLCLSSPSCCLCTWTF